jgi:hypothetical protein
LERKAANSGPIDLKLLIMVIDMYVKLILFDLRLIILIRLFPVVCHNKDAEEAVDDRESHDQRVEAVAQLFSEKNN